MEGEPEKTQSCSPSKSKAISDCHTRFGTLRGPSPRSLSDRESENEHMGVCVCFHTPFDEPLYFQVHKTTRKW